MTYPTGVCPSHITSFQVGLAACTTWTAAGGSSASIHYPTCNVSGETGTPDALPICLVNKATTHRKHFAEGAAGVLGGTFELIFYGSELTYPTAAEFESVIQGIIAELTAQQVGLLWGDPEIGDASDPTPQARAATQDGVIADYRSLTVTIPFGADP